MKVGWSAPGELQPPAAAFAGVSLLALAAARFYPFDAHPLVVCPLRAATGVPCPACGMTRAFVRLTHGDVGGAFQASPLGALLAALAALLVVWVGLRLTVLRRGVRLEPGPREARALRAGLVLAVAANWVWLVATRAAG